MANFRNTPDLMDDVLRRCGEMTSAQGVSPLTADALYYLNQIHQTIICGGNELETDVDESWVWAKARRPCVVNLNPPITSGSVSLTQGSSAGTFSQTPQLLINNVNTNQSVEGWYLFPTESGPEKYRIIQHTSGSTTFTLDAPFPQSSYVGVFLCFQLEYDLLPQYVTVDTFNDTLDFISMGTTAQVATITHGSYTPAALITAATTALTAADTNGNTYTGSYDTIQRYYTISSNLGGSATAVFGIVGNGTNFYRSGWDLLGYDYLTTSGSTSYTGTYPIGATARLSQSARCYYGYEFGYGSESGEICKQDPIAFDRDYPLIDLRMGTPQYFKVVEEKSLDGKLSVTFNKYPAQAMRVEFEHVPYPKDLQQNTASIPKMPKKYVRMLCYGASYYLSLDKTSDKAQSWLSTAKDMLKAMMKSNRTELEKTSKNFGAVIARPDLMPEKSYRRLNIYGYDASDT